MKNNSNDAKVIFRLFGPWQDEQEEIWLTKMASEGYHFVKCTKPGWYTFIKGESKKVKYCLDYQASASEREKYRQLFDDAGWEYAGEMNNWHYYRKEYEGTEAPEIFTDNESKIQKYKRVLMFFSLLLLSLGVLPLSISLLVRSEGLDFLRGFLMGMGSGITLIMVLTMSATLGRINQLKSRY